MTTPMSPWGCLHTLKIASTHLSCYLKLLSPALLRKSFIMGFICLLNSATRISPPQTWGSRAISKISIPLITIWSSLSWMHSFARSRAELKRGWVFSLYFAGWPWMLPRKVSAADALASLRRQFSSYKQFQRLKPNVFIVWSEPFRLVAPSFSFTSPGFLSIFLIRGFRYFSKSVSPAF